MIEYILNSVNYDRADVWFYAVLKKHSLCHENKSGFQPENRMVPRLLFRYRPQNMITNKEISFVQ